MSTHAPSERRARTRNEIKRLIEQRNTVLSQYYNLARNSEQDAPGSGNTLELLEEFCQHMVDYMATGHFEIYRRIEEGNERRDDMTKLADQVMPRINDTTQVAVAFNDLYDKVDNLEDDAIKQLPNYLAKLGEELATRIDLEDKFINALLNSGRQTELSAVSA